MKIKIAIIILTIIGFVACFNKNEHKTVICIPVYGQSLALGIETELITDFDSLTKYSNNRIVTERMDYQFGYYDLNEIKQFVKRALHYNKNPHELSVYNMAKWLSNHTGEDTVFCIFPGGQDGTIISNLGKGTKPYNKFLEDIKSAYKFAKDRGWDFKIPAICWMQGETDVNSYPGTNYKELILKFVKDTNTDIKKITGQDINVEIICYQTNSLTRAEYFNPLAYNCPETEVGQTQMELIRDSSMFHASGPTYPYDCVNEVIHIDGKGQMMHGILAALSSHDIITHHKNKRGLLPLTVKSNNMEVIIELSVPKPPLVFDTIRVAKADNYGFSVITPDNRNIIREVNLQNNSVNLLCTEPPKGCKVRYAVNGDYMKSGRLHGPRGNLRDSQGDSLTINIQGEIVPIHNWCYQFDIQIN